MRHWCGVHTSAQLARLARHLVGSLTQWGFGSAVAPLIPVASATTDESVRDAVKRLASSYVTALQDGSAPVETFEVDWHFSQLFKKFRFGCAMTDEEAHRGFLKRNRECCNHHLRWDIKARMRRLLALALPEVPLEQGRFGPGSVLEGVRTRAEKLEYTRLLAAKGYRLGDQVPPDVPEVAKLHAVPKDMFKKRTITVEPLTCQWNQQAVRSTMLSSVHSGILKGTIMDQTLRQTSERDNLTVWDGIDHDPVRRQQIRCARASLTGNLCTLDLSNASDTISWSDVSDVFPRWILIELEKCRSPKVVSKLLGIEEELFIYAGMGNATTFVVETLYFWALLTAIGELAHVGKPNVSVFGDDIVMSNKVAHNPWFLDKVRESGCQINMDKSGLSVGPGFREACGVVAYRGHVIPSTYRFYGYTATPSNESSYCYLVSRLLSDSHSPLNALGWALMAYDGAPDRPIISVPFGEPCVNDCLCYVLGSTRSTFVPPFQLKPISIPRRFNRRLQRTECRVKVVESRPDRSIVRDPIWGPGVVRSRGYWLYQLSLAGQFANRLIPDRVTTILDGVDPNRVRTRRRWIECAWSAYSMSGD